MAHVSIKVCQGPPTAASPRAAAQRQQICVLGGGSPVPQWWCHSGGSLLKPL